MERDLIIRLLDGTSEDGTLASPFKPRENQIHTILQRNEQRQTFELDQIAAIFMVGRRSHVMASNEEEIEEVELTTGERFRVRIIGGKQKYEVGFYGFPTEETSAYRMIFFTHRGIRVRNENRPLGKILAESGAISETQIAQALKEQEDLRSRKVGEILASQNKLDQYTIEKTIQEAMASGKISDRSRVGDILIGAGLVTSEQVDEALNSQSSDKKKRIGDLLVERGLISEEQLLAALATKFRMRFLNLGNLIPQPEAIAALKMDVVNRLMVIPIEVSGSTLVVATSRPTDPTIGDSLRFHTSRRIELVAATSKDIAEAIEKYYANTANSVEDLIGSMADDAVETIDETASGEDVRDSDSQIIKLVNRILVDAYQKGASDIHFEPGLEKMPVKVRYRLDGVCQLAHQVPSNYKNALISRLKIIAKLDISERRKPQSGKIAMRFEGRKVEFRMEVTPTVGENEDAVLRILASSKPLPLDKMGLTHTNLQHFQNILSKPYGIILCVGPTGSGKTTTLHSALGLINNSERKIWTAEDPVEITQSGLRQVQVNAKIGFTFSAALRSFLRADPDVIMIGEMRDAETAKTAIEASLTGHLVLSTLHTNSAPETIVRLIEMGMDPFNFSDAMLGIIAQRLSRRLCEKCKKAYAPDADEWQDLIHAYGADWYQEHKLPQPSPELNFFQKVGCEACEGIGYKGRVGIHELLVGTENLKSAIKQSAKADQLRDLAIHEGMRTLRMDGIQKVIAGQTDLEQVLRVCL